MNTKAKHQTKNRCVYIGLNCYNPELCYGQTGHYSNNHFYRDGVNPDKGVIVPQDQIWNNEVGYFNLVWV